jgi:hypothetical protein
MQVVFLIYQVHRWASICSCVGLARNMYILIFIHAVYTRCIYRFVGREITKYTVMYGFYTQFWPTLLMCGSKHTCEHTWAYTCKHTEHTEHTCEHTWAHTCKHTRKHTCEHTWAHVWTHSTQSKRVNTLKHTRVSTRVSTRVNTLEHTYEHTAHRANVWTHLSTHVWAHA